MLPAVATLRATSDQIFWYSVALVPVTLLLAVGGDVGWIYLAVAAILGAGFVYRAWRLRVEESPAAAMSVFKYSIYYLALLFITMAVDRLVLAS
jgi:protoheme IX farnesyltransferase